MKRAFKITASTTTALVLASTLGVAFCNSHETQAFAGDIKPATLPLQPAAGGTERHLVRLVDVTKTPCVPAAILDPERIENEHLALLAHQSRLEAELAGRMSIIIPEELRGRETTEPVQHAFREEVAAMQTHLTQVAGQIDAIQQGIELMKREGDVIEAKDKMMQRQVSLLQDQLDKVDALLKQGSATMTQKLALEQTLAQYSSAHLDLQLASLKSRQELLKAQQGIADTRNQARSQDLIELGQTQARLSDLSKAAEAAAAKKPAAAACDQAPGPIFEVVRSADGAMQMLPVAPVDKPELEPRLNPQMNAGG
jgi:hypothetical protein